MPLLDWLEEDEEDAITLRTYLVPIYKKQWGTFRVQAGDEEHARTEFAYMAISEIEANTEWNDDIEYEYESCGVIERE